MNEKLTTEQIVEIIRKYGDALPSGGFHLSSVYFEAVAKEITTNTAEDEVTVEQKEQRRVDDKMIRLFHMILDSQIKLYDAFQANTEPEDDYMARVAPFLARLIEPRYDSDETNDYICNSTDCENALRAYKDWLQQEDSDG